MWDWLRNLLASDGFMPHVHCYLQDPVLTGLHVVSDGLIGLAYVAISATLAYLVLRGRPDIPFHSMFLAFGVFIIACGATHFMEIWTTWNPTYWASGAVKVVTAIASVITAIALPPLVPVAVQMVRDARVSDLRRRELEAANVELKEVYARLKEQEELRTRLFTNVSHELRTPLALILGPAEAIVGDASVPEARRREAETIRTSARTLLKHVNDLLDISRLEQQELAPTYEELDLAALARTVASTFEPFARQHHLRFTVTTPEVLAVQADGSQLQRVLLNLLSNAFKFTPTGGTVRMELRPEGDCARIEVADSGPGIPAEMREAVFERFRQASGSSDERFGGTGLGLAIVQEFIQLHRGTTRVADAPEGGACLVVELPRSAPEGVIVSQTPAPAGNAAAEALAELAATRAEPLSTMQPETTSADGRASVLVVEDNAEMRHFIRDTLAQDYHVLEAQDGAAGLKTARERSPDLILTDLMMPQMSGEELIRALQQEPRLVDVPVLVLSARAEEETRTELLREGAQDYLMKPFSVAELRARVGNLVRIKRTHDLLRVEVAGHLHDLEDMASELGHRKRELQGTVEALRLSVEKARQASQVKTSFLRLVSHELRTPLTALHLQLHGLQKDRDGTLTPRQRMVLQKMGLSMGRLADLIESLLEYSRIDSGRLTVHRDEVRLGELVSATADELLPQAEQKGLELRVLAPALPPVLTDRRLSQLVIVNLVGNAVKFTERGWIELSAGETGPEQFVRVRDTGPGIASEQLDAIFEPFEQLEPMDYKSKPGVGLGLALAREIIQALGGRISVESAPGEGSTFTAYFPAPQRGAA